MTFVAGGSTSLFVRLQPDTTTANYSAYEATLSEQRLSIGVTWFIRSGQMTMSGAAPVASAMISPALANGKAYRLFFRVSGDPPLLETGLFEENGAHIQSVRGTQTFGHSASGDQVAFGFSGFNASRWERFVLIEL